MKPLRDFIYGVPLVLLILVGGLLALIADYATALERKLHLSAQMLLNEWENQ